MCAYKLWKMGIFDNYDLLQTILQHIKINGQSIVILATLIVKNTHFPQFIT